nr:hypothetical protein [Vulcanimicrobium alpinum]
MDIVYELGARQLATEFPVFPLEFFEPLRNLVGLHFGFCTLAHRTWIEVALIALPSPGIELR